MQISNKHVRSFAPPGADEGVRHYVISGGQRES